MNPSYLKLQNSNSKRIVLIAMGLVLLFSTPCPTNAQSNQKLFKGNGPWYEKSPSGDIKLYLYFFWSKECPHCRRAKPFLEDLQSRFSWVNLQQKEVTQFPENKALFAEMVDSLGETSRAVPTLMFCGGMLQGFDKPENSGAELTALLKDCHQKLTAFLAPPKKLPDIPLKRAETIDTTWWFTGTWWFRTGVLILVVCTWAFWRTNRLKK
ncbi:MAG: hypothetical protein G3M70_12555 [Candidatus Nitronauta litoralis]|uniref:Thioredoxin domain-containing protein n=1 Tax=Candidatus Nitronauta litoralis TaxID=2705533 RepID=A0A7T0G0R2_9BACT|nr:MAG: hypothetical protein G3M70_12555 [Candidatus Nitronauta litoralis]